MQGYEITSLSRKTQELIKQESLDTNADGLINKDNGELANLLSRTGKKDINQLCYNSWLDAKKEDLIVGGILSLASAHAMKNSYNSRPQITLSKLKKEANELFTKHNGTKPEPKSLDIPRTIVTPNPEAVIAYERLDKQIGGDIMKFAKERQIELQKELDQLRLDEIAERKAWNIKCAEWKPKVSMKECLKQSLKNNKTIAFRQNLPIAATIGILGLTSLGAAIHLFIAKPNQGVAKLIGNNNNYTPVERPRSEYEDQFRKVFGEEAELKEYTPQKGEYWISILKAKYGVDDAVAEKMAHKIKEVIYGDPLIGKQSPVMYLPETWTFEGNTYKFNNDNLPEKTINYSDDVKTEMGKMSKDIKYE